MFKLIKRIILLVVVLLIGGGVYAYYHADSLICDAIQKQASQSTHLETTLDAVKLSLFSGNVSLSNLQLASPPGAKAPHLFVLDSGSASVSYSQLWSSQDPYHIANVTLTKPRLVLELDPRTNRLTVQEAMDIMNPPAAGAAPAASPLPGGLSLPSPDIHLPSLSTTKPADNATPSTPAAPAVPATPAAPAAAPAKPIHVIIDTLTINDPTVVLVGFAGIDDNKEITLDSMTLTDVGNDPNSKNGAAMKDVVTAVMAKMMSQSLPQLTQIAGAEAANVAKGYITQGVSQAQSQLAGVLPDLAQLKGVPSADDLQNLNPLKGATLPSVNNLTKQLKVSTSLPSLPNPSDLLKGLGGNH